MFKIINFVHDNKKNSVNFDVEKNGEINHVEILETSTGCTSTRIDLFAGKWAHDEYDQLEEFKNGCQNLVHKFSHYEDEEFY